MAKIPDLLKKDLKVINMGLKSFYDSLKTQGAIVIQMDWKPPAGGKKDLLEILKKLR